MKREKEGERKFCVSETELIAPLMIDKNFGNLMEGKEGKLIFYPKKIKTYLNRKYKLEG